MTPGLLPLSLYRVTGRRKVPPTPTNEHRYRCFRDALPVRIGNAVDWMQLRVYGGGGVESRHAQSAGSAEPECGSRFTRVAPRAIGVSPSRSSARPASTFPGSQSGATPPGPPNPAGCLPDPDDSRDWDGRPLTYAELSRGW